MWGVQGTVYTKALFSSECYCKCSAHRCFTFGIGSGVSTYLVKGLAEAGNGTAEFIHSGERLQPKVGGVAC